MDDDYGFFVILDQEIDPLRIYMNRDTSIKNTDIVNTDILNTDKTHNKISHFNRPLSYNAFVKTFSISPVMNIYGIVCNVVNWLFSVAEQNYM